MATDDPPPVAGLLTADVGRLQQYLLTTLAMTGYGVFTWEIPGDRFSDDSQIDEVLGIPFMRDHDGDALPRMRALVHPDDLAAFDQRLAASLSPGGPEFRSEHRLILPRPTSAPEERWVSVIGRCEFSEDGAALAMAGVFGDVTDRRAEHAARNGRETLEALGRLTGGVAHDFDNVIGTILNFVQLAQREVGAGLSPNESLEEIHRGAARAADLMHGLRALGRDHAPRGEPFGLGRVVDEAGAPVSPAVGRGSTPTGRHPDDLPVADGDATSRADRAKDVSAAANALRVCFVDDEAALAMLARRAMPLSGCAVQAFTDPEEALASLSADPDAYDVLITDFSMPGMSGLELIVAAREVRPDLPVVLTSGYLDREDLADAERCGVRAIVRKPCSMDDLATAAAAQARPSPR